MVYWVRWCVANVVRDVVSTLTGGALGVAGLLSAVACLGGSLQILVWSLLTHLQPKVYQATLVICLTIVSYEHGWKSLKISRV